MQHRLARRARRASPGIAWRAGAASATACHTGTRFDNGSDAPAASRPACDRLAGSTSSTARLAALSIGGRDSASATQQ